MAFKFCKYGCKEGRRGQKKAELWRSILLQVLDGFGVESFGTVEVYHPIVQAVTPEASFEMIMNYEENLPPRGIANPGVACYKIAMIQALASCSPLTMLGCTPFQRGVKNPTDDLMDFLDVIGEIKFRGEAAREQPLSNLVSESLPAWLSHMPNTQEGCTFEFFNQLCGRLQEKVATPMETVMGRMFGFYGHTEGRCDLCNKKFSYPASFGNSFLFNIPPPAAAAAAAAVDQEALPLVNFFLSEYSGEVLTEKRCGEKSGESLGCDGRRIERSSVVVPPNVMALCFGRMTYDGNRLVKERRPVSLPLTFDMTPFIHDKVAYALQNNSYRLSSFIVHIGDGVAASHYMAVCRNGDSWFLCNDAVVTELTDDRLMFYLNNSNVFFAAYTRDQPVLLNDQSTKTFTTIEPNLPWAQPGQSSTDFPPRMSGSATWDLDSHVFASTSSSSASASTPPTTVAVSCTPLQRSAPFNDTLASCERSSEQVEEAE